MSDSTVVQPIKHTWVQVPDVAEFLMQNSSHSESIFVKVAAAQPPIANTEGCFELKPGASMNRLDLGLHWVFVWNHCEPAAFVEVVTA